MLRCGLSHRERKAGDTGTAGPRRARCGRRRRTGSCTHSRRGKEEESLRSRCGGTGWYGWPRVGTAQGVAETSLYSQKGRVWNLRLLVHGRGPGPSPTTAPVSSPALGTWLGRVVHDPDESLGQEMVVGGLLGCTGHRELDLLEFFRIHAWNAERGRLSVESPHQGHCSSRKPRSGSRISAMTGAARTCLRQTSPRAELKPTY